MESPATWMSFGLTAPAAVMVTVGLLPDGGGAEAEGGVVGFPPDEPPPPQAPSKSAITAAGARSPKKSEMTPEAGSPSSHHPSRLASPPESSHAIYLARAVPARGRVSDAFSARFRRGALPLL